MEIDKLFLKCIWKYKTHRIAKTILKKKNEIAALNKILRFIVKTVIKGVWYWCKARQVGKLNSIESPEKGPHIYSQLVFSNTGTTIQWRKWPFQSKIC